ncbi:uncharacterized protein LOC135202720 [Macrobrachium nipponense]|uniref:uncharacterized protein LOC135202720 n=1 Tax=Macrobrachium nipponense TaxID=159736 RepID=UPI0030C8A58B
MMRGITFLLGAASLCLARPDNLGDSLGLFPAEESSPALSVRAETTPTANQILDAIARRAVGNIREAGWGSSKNVQDGYSTIPFSVDAGVPSSEQFSITGGYIKGLTSLRRSKTASFSKDKSKLSGTLVAENVCATADYTVKFNGVGEAPAQNIKGKVTECVDKIFADLVVALDNYVPQNILSYIVRSGHDSVSVSNMGGNAMAKVHEAGIRKSLRQHIEKTMETNIKVKVNQAIQDMKAEGTWQ